MSLMQKVIQTSTQSSTATTAQTTPYQISITIYNAKQKHYPQTQQEWDTYDGIVITGSLSTAYENNKHEWIQTLMDVIQHEIHSHRRKTLGVCFGHQIYAHSFEKKVDDPQNNKNDNHNNDVDIDDDHNRNYGLAVKCPKGMQVGMREFESLPLLLHIDENHNHPLALEQQSRRNKIKMFYTHGDMVQSIPPCALSLGGNHDVVPIQACAYFPSSNEKDLYLQSLSSLSSSSLSSSPKPYAITFQGHPEYASKDVGLTTYLNILSFLEKQQKVPKEILSHARQDAKDSFEDIERNCIALMRDVMITLGWLI